MAPTPQEHGEARQRAAPAADGERVVISGMSGLYPNSPHVKELERILYEKINPVTDQDCRWKFPHPEVRDHCGKVPGLDRFDGQFFKVHYRLGNNMDPMARKILEQTFQAIYDAGVSPVHLSGKRVAVYTGSCFSETEKAFLYVASNQTGFGIAGCNKAMFANRISYWLNLKGPSMNIDEACCSSFAALELAHQAITRGECEAAIVGGCHLSLHPQSSVHYGRIMTICADGKTKSFDENADGIAKSEAINVLFLQKAKDAKRIYAEVLHVKSEFTDILKNETGGPKYGFYRNPDNMANFLNYFYEEADVPPQAVEYVEAFGSAVPEADKAELEAIEKVFCKNKQNPLLVGSVMSNIGYAEAASGISAITKVLLGYQNGSLAANLHCSQPRRDVAALRDGRMQIVTEHRRFGRSYAAVNGISVTGVNAHVLLHGHYKPKDPNRYKSAIPHLVTISGRQDTAVQKIFEDLKSRPIDPEELALFHNIHGTRISGHIGRGYVILDTDPEGKTVALAETASYFDDAKRPLWFVYSGMGSQWAGMGSQLMRLPVFAAAIERCRKALEPKGIDIVHIITSSDKEIFDNILNSFVGIAAIQIGLTDVLTSLGIVPDKIIGHSVGELGCAYADGCFTAEEMILSAYSRGLVSLQTPFIRGSMAAVGIGYQQIVDLLPLEIEVACHNGPDSCTISGPADKMKEFVAQLSAKSIFAKEVPCSNIAYHSRYIAEAGPGLLKYLSEVIKEPRPRSERWVSTSVPKDRWGEENAKYSSAFYHTNNLLNPVLFEETSRLIPANAVTVEIAPHGLLQAILKRALPESCKHIPLTRRGHPDNVFMVLDAVGKLYMEGYLPQVQALYPEVQFPVSTGTPMLSHLVEWAHAESWSLPLFVPIRNKQAASCTLIITTHDKEHSYLRGNCIGGENLYPFSAALVAAWDTLAMSLNQKRKQISVEFRDVQLHAQPPLLQHKPLRLNVALHRANGRFEIMNEDRVIASGYVYSKKFDENHLQSTSDWKDTIGFTSDDIYQMLYEKDFFYQGDFRSIRKVDKSFTEAQILWNDNWVTFLDGILQFHALRANFDTVAQPFQIKNISISLEQQAKIKNDFMVDGKSVVLAHVLDNPEVVRCGGVLIEKVQFRKLPVVDVDIMLRTVKFVPRFHTNDIPNALRVYLQIVAENVNKDVIKFLGVANNKENLKVFSEFGKILNEVPGVVVNFEYTTRDKVQLMRESFLDSVDVVLVQNLSSDDDLCQKLYRVLCRDTFLINRDMSLENCIRRSALYHVLCGHNTNKTRLELIKWRPTQLNAASTVVTVRNISELPLLTATRNDLAQRHKLVILSSYPAVPGLKDLVKSWRTEADKNQIYLVMISDNDNLDQLPELDLAYSVLLNGVWGGDYVTSCEEQVTVDRGVTLRSSRVGDLDSLHWVETGESTGYGVPVTVHYTALNNIDAKKATGEIPIRIDKELSYGMDFSGVTDNGERVMGVVESGSASSRVMARPELLWPVPVNWSLEDAATVPSAYAHAFYILYFKTGFGYGFRKHALTLKSHSRQTIVLVHGATGGLGQALISILLAHDCIVFATVSDIRKKRFLMRLFPQLQEDHIGNSRDESFADMVLTLTQGLGCNLVISCLKANFKNVSLNCLAGCGTMIDTAQIPYQENYSFGMFSLTRERNYFIVNFGSLFTENKIAEMKEIQVKIAEGIARGYVRPLLRVSYLPEEVGRAFRLIATSRHLGRALIRPHDKVPETEPRLTCSPDMCQIIICDKQCFGLQLAERLVNRGAKNLHLHCRVLSNYVLFKMQSWEAQNVNVRVSCNDLTNKDNIYSLFSGKHSVEGVFVVAIDADVNNFDMWAKLVTNLDSAVGKLCPSLRHFAVINTNMIVGHATCIARAKDGLPNKVVNLPSLKMPNENNSTDSLSWHSAVNAIEKALRSSSDIVVAHPKTVKRPTLLQEIANILEINVSDERNENTTLLDLGIDVVKVPLICSVLKDRYHLPFPEETIPSLTIQRIKELNNDIHGTELKKIRGLECFYQFVDPDEINATTEIVFLPTLTSVLKNDNYNMDIKNLCIIPGLEGHHGRFKILCERLKLPALVLQPGLDLLHETVRETAERYVKILLRQACVRENFYLLGYESGTLVALEVASILEDHGFTGTVFCLGCSPEEFQELLEEELSDIPTDEALQDAVVRHMFSLMTGHSEGIDKALQNVSDWKQKVEVSVRTLLGQVPHSAQYARNLIEAAYTKLKAARLYEVQPFELKSKLVLLHASSLHSVQTALTSLQRFSQLPVTVHQLEETLPRAALDLRCSAIINDLLDPEILKAYEEFNTCDTYVNSKEAYMMNSLDKNK